MRKHRVVELIGIVLALAIVITLILSLKTAQPNAPTARSAPPTMTAEEKAFLASTSTPAALIAYTDTGFQPATTTIKQGQAVRFFNASSKGLLWVAATGGSSAYPDTGSCGESAFDTCHSIDPRHYWQFTFMHTGTWHYRNNATPNDTGTIIVE